jgi:trehalose synthase
MMRTLLPYWRGAGIDVRWIVVTGPQEFFRVTKRLHNWLHGSLGDSGPLGPDQFALLRRIASAQLDALIARVAPGDTVVLHDPQTASLVAPLKCAGARVVWRCHIGADQPNERVERAWEWLLPQVARADALVFTRTAFVPPVARAAGIRIITPAIDPASLKNQPLSPELARAIGQQMGVLRGQPAHPAELFRADGSVIRITRRAQVLAAGPPPRAGIDPIVLSLCRWDRLKDQIGIIAAFAQHVLPSVGSAHLIVAGPEIGAIQDDPESHEVFQEVRTAWERLPIEQRSRVHLASLPFDPLDENAAMVNALQTLADVVVKKSIQEGLGLGVTEALWKARPVVATRVGGHREQIRDGYHGLLVDHPKRSRRLWNRDRQTDPLSRPCRSAGTRRARTRAATLPRRSLLPRLDEAPRRRRSFLGTAARGPNLDPLDAHASRDRSAHSPGEVPMLGLPFGGTTRVGWWA